MGSITVYSDVTKDGYIESFDTSTTLALAYDAACAGTGDAVTAYPEAQFVIVGQDGYGTSASVYETFLSFDTSGVTSSKTVSAVDMYAYVSQLPETDFTLEVRTLDWSTSDLTAADYVVATDLSGDTLLASLSTTGLSMGWVHLTSETAFNSAIVKTGTTYVYLSSSATRSETDPTGADYIGIDNVQGKNSLPVKLVITYDASPVIAPTGIRSAEFVNRAVLTDGQGNALGSRGIWIRNSLGTYGLSDDSRFRVLDTTDFGQVAFSVEENINPLADVDGQMSDNWGKLREIVLRIRIFGATADEVMENAEWLQRMVTRDDEWWLDARRDGGDPFSHFKILKTSPFPVPYNMMLLARKKVDVEVTLLAEPYVYADEEFFTVASSVTAPGQISIDTIKGTFPVPLKVDVSFSSSPSGGPSYFALSDDTATALEMKLYDCVNANPSTMTNHENLSNATASGSRATEVYYPSATSVYRLSTGSAPTGLYRVLLRCRDTEQMDSDRGHLKVAITDTTASTESYARHHWREFRWGDDDFTGSEGYGWSWLDVGEWQSTGGRTMVLWLKGPTTMRYDSIFFLPIADGVIGTNQDMYRAGLYGYVSNPYGYCSDPPTYTEDDSTLTRLSYGGGVLVSPGTSLGKYLVFVASQDGILSQAPSATTSALTVTVSYTPRYSSWVAS